MEKNNPFHSQPAAIFERKKEEKERTNMKDEREHSNLKSSQILVKKSAPFGKRSQNLYSVQGYNTILCTKVYSRILSIVIRIILMLESSVCIM